MGTEREGPTETVWTEKSLTVSDVTLNDIIQ